MSKDKVQVAAQIYPVNGVINVDYRYGPYESIAEAVEFLGPDNLDCIKAGLKFGIKETDGTVTDYVFLEDNGGVDKVQKVLHIDEATTEKAGLMSAQDKSTLAAVQAKADQNAQDIEGLGDDISDANASIQQNASAIQQNTAGIGSINASIAQILAAQTELRTAVNGLTGIDNTNYKGIFPNVSSLPDMDRSGWALVGSSLSSLLLYTYTDVNTVWTLYSNDTYDFTDYSGLVSQVAQIGSNLGNLANLQTTDKSSVVAAINEVKNNASTTAQNTSYVDNRGLEADNVQDALDAVGVALYGIKVYNGYEDGIYIMQSNGIQTNDSGWALSEYIPFTSGSEVRVVFQREGVDNHACASFYDENKTWKAGYTTNGYTNERTVTPTMAGLAYVRFGFSSENIESCEAYIDGKLVWNYTGVVATGITEYIEKIPQIEDDIAGLSEGQKTKAISSIGTLASPSYIIVASGKWSSGTSGHSAYFKEVEEGEVYRFLGNATNAGYYAFLKDTTRSSGGTPNYADGETGRYSIPIGAESADITVPATASYMYICNTNANLDQKPQALYRITPVNDAVESLSSDVEEIKDVLGIGDGGETSGFSYYGEKIAFSNTMNFSSYATNAASGQSSAIYGDYLFIVREKLTSIVCYNMATKTLLCTLSTGYSKSNAWHCNQSQFGTLRVNENDVFPVLYITVNNDSNGRCSWVAYRIIPTYTDDEISSFTIEEVQTIYLPAMTDDNCLGNVNIAVDYDRNLLWGYGRNNRTEADNAGKATFVCFPMPALSETTVTYEDADIIDTFQDDWNMTYAQGGFIKNGKLVIMQGYASVNLINLRVIDLYAQRKQVSFADLLNNGFTNEPEGVFYYYGNIYTSTNNTRIWRILIS